MSGVKLNVPENVMLAEADGEMVLLNTLTGQVFGLDSIGCRFWEHITTSKTYENTLECLLNEFDVMPEKLQVDFKEFIAKLEKVGLIAVDGVITR